MGDIFDQLIPDSTGTAEGGGDVFDRLIPEEGSSSSLWSNAGKSLFHGAANTGAFIMDSLFDVGRTGLQALGGANMVELSQTKPVTYFRDMVQSDFDATGMNPQWETEGGQLLGAAIEGVPMGAVTGSPIAGFTSGGGAKFAELTGQSPILGALAGGLAPGLVSGAVRGVGSGMKAMGENLEDATMGVTKGAYARSLANSGVWQDGENLSSKLKTSLRTVKEEGLLKGDKSPSALIQKAEQRTDQLYDDLSNVLKDADTKLGKVGEPTWDNTLRWIEKQPAADQGDLLLAAQEEITAMKQITAKDSLVGWNEAKRALYRRAYTETGKAKETIRQYLARDIKQFIEQKSDSVLPQGKAGVVKNLNQKIGAHHDTAPVLQQGLAGAEARTPEALARKFVVGGGPIALLASAAGLPWGASLLLASLGELPSVAFKEASLLKGIGGGIGAAGKTLPSLAQTALPTLTNLADIRQQDGQNDGDEKGASNLNHAPTVSPYEQLSQLLSPPAAEAEEPGGQNAVDFKKTLLASLTGLPMAFGGPDLPQDERSSKGDTRTMAETGTKAIDSKLTKAVVKVESGGNPKAKSKAGAQGLMQLMPATGKEWAKKLGYEKYDPYDAEQNVTIGTAYLNWLIKKFKGDKELGLAAYNYGIGRVLKLLSLASSKGKERTFDGIKRWLPEETRKYVPKVMALYNRSSETMEA